MRADLDLSPFDRSGLDAEAATVYAVDQALRICFTNRAWTTFARENGADWAEDSSAVLGTHVMTPIPAILQPFYSGIFEAVLRRGEVVEHDYECSSPAKLRQFRMRILPRAVGGAVVVHSRLIEVDHGRIPTSPTDSLFRDANGMIVQCSHCRRVRRVDDPAVWDWVPAYVQSPPEALSHGLCRVCAKYYYPDSDDLEMTGGEVRTLKVLLVDDDQQLRTIAARILRKEGYSMLDASDAAGAFELMLRETVDVLMTDMTMPGMGGVRLAVSMRELDPSLRVVFISGGDISQEVRKSVPGASFVRKPFTRASLVAGVQQAARGR